MKRKRPPRRFRAARPRPGVRELLDEAIAVYHWLAWVSEQIYGEDARGVARRWTLRRLHRAGAQTVPELARARVIRRQSLQPVVDGLVRDGLAELATNPAHARSRLVRLTRRGEEMASRFDRIDDRVLGAVARGVPESTLRAAAQTLRALRLGFENEARWRASL